jgi:hypothetical protein
VDVVAVVAVAVAVVLGADVLHLVDGAALGAALDGAVARGGEPDDNVRVGGVAGATLVLLVAVGLDDDGVVQRACGRRLVSVLVLFRHADRGFARVGQAACRG